MRRTLLMLCAVVVAAAGARVAAHHAFGAEFDPDAPLRLQGKIVRLEWVNPHTWIHMEIAKPDGTAEVWAVEGGTPNTLLRRGLTRDTLKIGTEIIVDGYQTKDHSLKRANGRDVTFTERAEDLHGLVGHRRPERRPRPNRAAQEKAGPIDQWPMRQWPIRCH